MPQTRQMESSEDGVFSKLGSHPKASNWRGGIDLSFASGLTALAFLLGSTPHLPSQILGALLFTVCMYHWFSIVHSSGHGAQFKTKWLNHVSGLIASLFSGVPYFTWRRLHFLHHRWNGLQGKDPTVSIKNPEDVSETTKRLIDFLWKFHIPVFGLSFLLSVFHNPLTYLKFARDKEDRFLFLFSSIWFFGFHTTMISIFGFSYAGTLLIGFTIFCLLADPILLGQHCYLPEVKDMKESNILSPQIQNSLTRTLSFGKFADRWIFAQYTNHTLHHLNPSIPHYLLHQSSGNIIHQVNGWSWFMDCRKIKGREIVFGKSR